MLNDRIESGPCLRARLQAARADPDGGHENMVTHAATTLAAHGIYIRDGGHALASRIMDILAHRDKDRARVLGEVPLLGRGVFEEEVDEEDSDERALGAEIGCGDAGGGSAQPARSGSWEDGWKHRSSSDCGGARGESKTAIQSS